MHALAMTKLRNTSAVLKGQKSFFNCVRPKRPSPTDLLPSISSGFQHRVQTFFGKFSFVSVNLAALTHHYFAAAHS